LPTNRHLQRPHRKPHRMTDCT